MTSSMRDYGAGVFAPTGCEVMRPSRLHRENGLEPPHQTNQDRAS